MIWFWRHFSFQVLGSFRSDCCELLDLLITTWIYTHAGFPSLPWMFFSCSLVVEFSSPTKMGTQLESIFHSGDAEKAPPFCCQSTFYDMSAITPSHQFFTVFAPCKADFLDTADKPGLETQLCCLTAGWHRRYFLTKAHFLIWKTMKMVGTLGKFSVLIHESI